MFADDTPKEGEDILIIDGAADISCIGKGFSILFRSGESISLGIAVAGAHRSEYEIVTAAAVIIDPQSTRDIIIIINQAANITT